MRQRRQLARLYTAAATVLATAAVPCSVSAQELNPPQVQPPSVSSPAARVATLDRSIMVGVTAKPNSSTLASLDDSEFDAIAMPRGDAPVPQAESIVSAELLQQRGPDGKVQVERWVTEDAAGNLVNHGLYKEYDAKGAVVRTGNFRMGVLDGVWKQTIPLAAAQRIANTIDAGFRAPFHSEAKFTNGNLDGDWTLSDSVGNAVAVLQFEKGLRSGSSIWLSSRGKAVREVNYRNGVPDGPATQMVATQKEPQKIMFFQGKVLQTRTTWHDPDRKTKKKLEESFLVSDGEQFVSHDWWNSQITAAPVSAVEQIRHGTLIGWHPNGAKSVEGQFAHDQPVGEFSWWYPSGQLQSTGTYDSGVMVGAWSWWFPNGMKMLHGEYQAGKHVGVWSQWDLDGKLVQRDEAANFPSVRQDILPTPDPTASTAAAPQAASGQSRPSQPTPTTRTAPTPYRVRR